MPTFRQLALAGDAAEEVNPGWGWSLGMQGEVESWWVQWERRQRGILSLSAAPCWDGAEETEMGSPQRCPVMGQEALVQNVTREIVISYPRLLKNEVF